MQRSSAFTLLEILVGAALFVAVTAGMVLLLHQTIAGAAHISSHRHAHALAEDLSDRWDAEAASAFAIFVPATDVLGTANGDGHEVDFFARDGGGQPLLWAYRFDASSHVLQRYTYVTPGAAPTLAGEPLDGVASFSARTIGVDAFSEPVFQGAGGTPVVENLGYPGVDGGNHVVEVQLTTGDDAFTQDLVAGVAPSGFTIVVGTYTPAPSPLVVTPPSLTFASPKAAPQPFTVSQQYFTGSFGVAAQCVVGPGQSVAAGTVAATVSGNAAGPSATFTVTPNASMTNTLPVICNLPITGAGGASANEQIGVDPSSHPPITLTLSNVTYLTSICAFNGVPWSGTFGPFTAAQAPSLASVSAGTVTVSSAVLFSYTSGTGDPTAMGVASSSVGTSTDTTGWSNDLSSAAAVPGSTTVYLNMSGSLQAGCGGGA